MIFFSCEGCKHLIGNKCTAWSCDTHEGCRAACKGWTFEPSPKPKEASPD